MRQYAVRLVEEFDFVVGERNVGAAAKGEVRRELLRERHFSLETFVANLRDIFAWQREAGGLRYGYVAEPEDIVTEVIKVGQFERNPFVQDTAPAGRCRTVWPLPR